MSDIEIAQQAHMQPIIALAAERLSIAAKHLDPYGHYKAKLSLEYIDSLKDRPNGRLILVTAISPTPAGEGKTTTTVGLGDALNRIGKSAMICLREPALGPCFGVKGGAAGGGYAQVVPMEDINLHFTGDFHAIGVAHNLLAAMIDNHIHQGNTLNLDLRRIHWKRVMDMNDRALRDIVVGLGGAANGFPREDGFDIIAASEVMAILCLSNTIKELKQRLGNILVGYSHDGRAIFARELNAHGAMAALLKDALRPNMVQTLENNPVFVHGGPFANIAHGCNTVIATKTALKMADIVVTEAGFGADLGAEKFIDIKCRKAGLQPDAVVLVATVRALKSHGGVAVKELTQENLTALEAGFVNLARHLSNVQEQFGLPCIVAINHFVSDSDAEIALLKQKVEALDSTAIICRHWAEGGKGAEALAHAVIDVIERGQTRFNFLYQDDLPLWDKIRTVATRLYGAADISADDRVRRQLAELSEQYPHYPVCIAKTQSSFTADPTIKGAPSGHVLPIREVRPAHGAEFVVAICGSMMTMPGLPKVPAAEHIDVDDNGKISGLF
ncbi:formate--tetrahydrofolate ligase [Candidatus Methylospira mobilis]|uniref:Formate--tetrahydrofolate ligase n=1 Tax=Candidatus Methylospira mobilis TaxID=1808979 RepID=A0A5Q0BS76_9GAMM|nr:formate--tetrahydrofolate ligase [Candidatus Methylospira mobilis]QFY44928.1 formate--tetrahydrofolate ligase [Candidatus Methylospira mobilis]WNV06825.1 formate--tetrahydrofolate ligase [Candidatus Methylospira mobilis]